MGGEPRVPRLNSLFCHPERSEPIRECESDCKVEGPLSCFYKQRCVRESSRSCAAKIAERSENALKGFECVQLEGILRLRKRLRFAKVLAALRMTA